MSEQTEVIRRDKGRWVPGQSGNPAARFQPGNKAAKSRPAQNREACHAAKTPEEWKALIAHLYDLALTKGDTQAAALALKYGGCEPKQEMEIADVTEPVHVRVAAMLADPASFLQMLDDKMNGDAPTSPRPTEVLE